MVLKSNSGILGSNPLTIVEQHIHVPTQPFIHLWSINRVPASVGVKVGRLLVLQFIFFAPCGNVGPRSDKTTLYVVCVAGARGQSVGVPYDWLDTRREIRVLIGCLHGRRPADWRYSRRINEADSCDASDECSDFVELFLSGPL